MLRMLSFFSICNLEFVSRLQVYGMKEYKCILFFVCCFDFVCCVFFSDLRFSIYYVCNNNMFSSFLQKNCSVIHDSIYF